MLLTMTSWLVSGRPRQFIVMWENSRCSIWGEMRAFLGARQLAGAKPWRMGAAVRLPGFGELDGEAGFLQLAYQAAGLVLLVVAGGEVVLAEAGEYLPGGEDVPDHVEEAAGDRDGGLVRAPAAGDLPVLGAEVAALGP